MFIETHLNQYHYNC